jgi:hypothetical protein
LVEPDSLAALKKDRRQETEYRIQESVTRHALSCLLSPVSFLLSHACLIKKSQSGTHEAKLVSIFVHPSPGREPTQIDLPKERPK